MLRFGFESLIDFMSQRDERNVLASLRNVLLGFLRYFLFLLKEANEQMSH